MLNLVFQFHPRNTYVPPALQCLALQQLAPICCCCCWPQLALNALKVRPECLANFHLFMPRSREREGEGVWGLLKAFSFRKRDSESKALKVDLDLDLILKLNAKCDWAI